MRPPRLPTARRRACPAPSRASREERLNAGAIATEQFGGMLKQMAAQDVDFESVVLVAMSLDDETGHTLALIADLHEHIPADSE